MTLVLADASTSVRAASDPEARLVALHFAGYGVRSRTFEPATTERAVNGVLGVD